MLISSFIIQRELYTKIISLAQKFPVINLTGTRQYGKSTLLKASFPDYAYVSLEDPDMRELVLGDPRGFLNTFKNPLIIDEAQYAPKLFSFIQGIVDAQDKPGMFILSGSHNFLLMQSISQSLAGRSAVLRLSTFSIDELSLAKLLPKDCNSWIYQGGYPRIYDKNIEPADFFPSCIQTYIERDVRLLKNINDISLFVKFLRLCAGRSTQVVNISSLANECGIASQTAVGWLSVLETSNVIFFLEPYYKNFNKRLVKSPKLYFYDTGLVCSLLGLDNPSQLALHYMRGELFENMVISECYKKAFAKGRNAKAWFWRDNNQNEIDLLIEKGGTLYPIEIKSGETMQNKYFSAIRWFKNMAHIPTADGIVIYGGDTDFSGSEGRFISWRNTGPVFS